MAGLEFRAMPLRGCRLMLVMWLPEATEPVLGRWEALPAPCPIRDLERRTASLRRRSRSGSTSNEG